MRNESLEQEQERADPRGEQVWAFSLTTQLWIKTLDQQYPHYPVPTVWGPASPGTVALQF